jgi:hypothetical protein
MTAQTFSLHELFRLRVLVGTVCPFWLTHTHLRSVTLAIHPFFLILYFCLIIEVKNLDFHVLIILQYVQEFFFLNYNFFAGKALYQSWIIDDVRHLTHILEDLSSCKE